MSSSQIIHRLQALNIFLLFLIGSVTEVHVPVVATLLFLLGLTIAGLVYYGFIRKEKKPGHPHGRNAA